MVARSTGERILRFGGFCLDAAISYRGHVSRDADTGKVLSGAQKILGNKTQTKR